MKNPKIKEQQQLKFYAEVMSLSREDTVTYCTKLIQGARAPNYTLMNQLKSMGRDNIIFATNNFIMKGQGRGV